MWRELVRVYAIRAREFSDSAARLGKQARIGPEFLELLEEAKGAMRFAMLLAMNWTAT